jgi:hypothetical protein
MDDRQQLLFGKTSPESSQRKTTPSGSSSEDFLGAMRPLKLKTASGIKQAFFVQNPSEWVGEPLMHSISVLPNAGGECSSLPQLVNLSEILESGPVHPKYFLSAKACSGILRRAERRGKKLPSMLLRALEQVAAGVPERESQEDKTM